MIGSERSHSSNTTTSEPEGELLHWKKGNLLGRGAFGTVSTTESAVTLQIILLDSSKRFPCVYKDAVH